MKLSEARKVLGLEAAAATLTEEIVVTAWREAVKRAHPDTAAQAFENHKAEGVADLDASSTVWSVDTLTTAKKVCLDSLSGADLSCKLCGGIGKVRAKMGLTTCGSCKGTGDRQ